MATLTVLKFDTADGAKNELKVLEDLSKQQMIKLQDAAIVTWVKGKKKPKTEHLTHLTRIGALSGAFWGLLFGILFFIPLVGLAAGAALGAVVGSMKHVGIDEDFIKSIRSKVTEGTSALFLMTSDAVEDRVVEAMKQSKFEIIATNLSKEEEEKMRATFAEENYIDLIVMGSHGKSAIQRFLIGSLAEKVVKHSKIEVLVVRKETAENVLLNLVQVFLNWRL